MIDTPENDVRPIRPERPADTLIERPVTVVAVVPVDDILTVVQKVVAEAVAAALIVVLLGALIGFNIIRRENER